MANSPKVVSPEKTITQPKLYITPSTAWDYSKTPIIIVNTPPEDLNQRKQSFLLGGWSPFKLPSIVVQAEEQFSEIMSKLAGKEKDIPTLLIVENSLEEQLPTVVETCLQLTEKLPNLLVTIFVGGVEATEFDEKVQQVTLPLIYTPPVEETVEEEEAGELQPVTLEETEKTS